MQETIVASNRASANYWRDLWHFRELFIILAWRDVAVRYKQTALGVAWSVLRPLINMVIFVFLFGTLARLPSNGVPYALLVMCALVPWQLFSNGLAEASNSLIANPNLVSKVYFPRLIMPASSVVVSVVDALITMVMLAGLMAWYRVVPPMQVLALPFFLLLAYGAALGAGLWLCALNVKFRDFRYVVPFMLQVGYFVSPVGYDSAYVQERLGETWRWVFSLNPMVGIIEGFRWCLLGDGFPLYAPSQYLSIAVTAVLLLTGVWYFRRTEKGFADLI